MLVKSTPLKALKWNGQLDLYSTFASVQLRKSPLWLIKRKGLLPSSVHFVSPSREGRNRSTGTDMGDKELHALCPRRGEMNNFSPEKIRWHQNTVKAMMKPWVFGREPKTGINFVMIKEEVSIKWSYPMAGVKKTKQQDKYNNNKTPLSQKQIN